ncbi:prepilin peptidase, partial [Candidatus Uhrbacteria bacterium]|nr:prepilin peptidase [Candidatus Uhrbacteria bacterium]
PFLFELIFSYLLLLVSVFDFRWKLIPVELLLTGTAIFTLWSFLSMRFSLVSLVLGIAVGFLFLGIQVWISGGKWMGEGDPWLGAFLGAALGWPSIGISLYLTYIGGALLALVIFFSGNYKRGFRIPFAPLLSIGGILSLWFSPLVVSWLTQTF